MGLDTAPNEGSWAHLVSAPHCDWSARRRRSGICSQGSSAADLILAKLAELGLLSRPQGTERATPRLCAESSLPPYELLDDIVASQQMSVQSEGSMSSVARGNARQVREIRQLRRQTVSVS